MIFKAIYLVYFMENNFWYFPNLANVTQFSKKKKRCYILVVSRIRLIIKKLEWLKKISKLNQILFWDSVFWIFNIFIYINFECNNTNESIFIIIKSLLFLIVIFYFFMKFTELSIGNKKIFHWNI